MNPARSVGGIDINAVIASGVDSIVSGSPDIDITETSDAVRVGCSMAKTWAIMPPIDAPMMCALSMPR